MKTENIKQGYTTRDKLNWYLKCLDHLESGGELCSRGDRYTKDNIEFTIEPELYNIIQKPGYIPYSKNTFDELEEKAMRMMIIHNGSGNRYTVNWLLDRSFKTGAVSYTYNESIDMFKWSDGSEFGTEIK